MLELLIKNGVVIDGTGKPRYRADMGVADGRIVVLEQDIDREAEHSIDAEGLVVAPGFVDPHTHSDLTLLVDGRAQSKIRQGVTTEVIGNCGFSPAPLAGAANEEVRSDAEQFGLSLDWQSMSDYLERLSSSGTSVNVVPLVGHNTVRGSVLGYDDVQPTLDEQATMEEMVGRAMREGARGLSTGLYYPPGYYAETDEVTALSEVVARLGGIHATHMRSESDHLLDALDEAIEVAERSGVRIEVAHLKLEGYRNWQNIDALVDKLDAILASDLPVACDQYPYIACSTWISAILPYWAQSGGGKAVARRLQDPEVRTRLRQDWEENRAEWDSRSGIQYWSDLMVSRFPGKPELQGETIEDLAASRDEDPLEVLFDLIVESEGLVGGVWFTQREENVKRLMQHPLVAIGSDGYAVQPEGILGERQWHPRSYGTFPRVLGRYVREEGTLTLEEAVRKMTSLTADRFGLERRGVLAEGAWADVTLFDPETVIDQATFSHPNQYPVGIPYVIVNGELVIDRGEHTDRLPGRVL
jgi:N-acyl-D-amino-acid deacylase